MGSRGLGHLREKMRKSERDVPWQGSGGHTRRSIRRTNASPNPEVVPSTADQEIGLETAGALNKFVDPGPLEGPGREAAATNGAKRETLSCERSVTDNSVSEGSRARDTIQRDLAAASFKFIGVVSELQVKLDSGERLLRPIKPVKDVGRQVDVSTEEDRWFGLKSLVMMKLDRLLDRCSPEPQRMSSEDPDRTLEIDKDSEPRHRYHRGSHVTTVCSSLASGKRRAESVAWETPRGRARSRVRFEDSSEEDRSMIREQDGLTGRECRSPRGRRTSAFQRPSVLTEGPLASQRGGRARFEEALSSSDETVRQSSQRESRTDAWTRLSEQKGAGDRGNDSVRRQSEGRSRRSRRDSSDPSSDPSSDECYPRIARRRESSRCECPDFPGRRRAVILWNRWL